MLSYFQWVTSIHGNFRKIVNLLNQVLCLKIFNTTYHVPPTFLPFYKHWVYQTTWFGAHTQKKGCTKPRAHFFAQEALNAPNHMSTFNQSAVMLLHKRIPPTLYGTPSLLQLHRQHYTSPVSTVSTDYFSPQHGRWTFSLYFINSFPHPTIPTDYPPFPFSTHSPHSPTLYLLPAKECYPPEPTNILYSPASGRCCFFWIRSLIQLPLHHSHTRFSTPQPILPNTWPSPLTPTPPYSQAFYQFRLCQGPNEWGSLVRTDAFLIFPCFLGTWTEINALTINDSSSLRLRKLAYH